MKLLVIDNAEITTKIESALEGQDHQLVNVGSLAAAMRSLEEGGFDAVFFDYNHNPGGGGLSGLEELIKLNPKLKVIVLTASASIETAVESMRVGAFDYIPKPFSPDQIRRLTARLSDPSQAAATLPGDGQSALEPGEQPPNIQVGMRVTLEELEHAHIRRILSHATSMEEAAQVLGIDPATLYRKRKRFGL